MPLDANLPDYIASVAGNLPGITGVFGTGQGVIGDPFRPGQTILAAPDAPTGTYTFWADLPNGRGEWLTQDGAEEWTWDFPTRLWLPRADLANMRRQAHPLYEMFRAAFAADRTLGGRVARARVSAFDFSSDDFWSWLDININVIEQVLDD